MAIICHGAGNLEGVQPGCCYVNGEVCPLRLNFTGGRVVKGVDTDLGTIEQWALSQRGKRGQDTARKIAQGATRFACDAASRVLIDDPNMLADPSKRLAFNGRWDRDGEYVAQVRPVWDAVEDAMGVPRGTYNCSTWQGTDRPQCCFAESAAVNAEKASGLDPEVRAFRTAGGREGR